MFRKLLSKAAAPEMPPDHLKAAKAALDKAAWLPVAARNIGALEAIEHLNKVPVAETTKEWWFLKTHANRMLHDAYVAQTDWLSHINFIPK